MKNAGSFHCQRAVHIDREISVTLHQFIFLDFTDKIQDLLGSSHCKRGNHHISAAVKGLLQNPGKFPYIIRPVCRMKTITIGGFHDHIICFLRLCRILDQRLVFIPDITGKYDLAHLSLFRSPHLYTGRAKQMSHIRKPYLYSVT